MYTHTLYYQEYNNAQQTISTNTNHKPEDHWSCKRSPDILA